MHFEEKVEWHNYASLYDYSGVAIIGNEIIEVDEISQKQSGPVLAKKLNPPKHTENK